VSLTLVVNGDGGLGGMNIPGNAGMGATGSLQHINWTVFDIVDTMFPPREPIPASLLLP
jgi:hypothetical protein